MLRMRISKLSSLDQKKKAAFFLFFLFLVIFPKGGFKINEIPITWGYLLLLAISFIGLLRKCFYTNTWRTSILISLIPFQIILLTAFLFNGVESENNGLSLGFAFSFILAFVIFPYSFLILLTKHLDNIETTFFIKIFKRCVFIVCAYGIFLFFFKIITGSFLEIPFLTVNFHDIGNLENKCINRGLLFKLISTYNNGNLFGVCILLLLPVYELLEKSVYKKILVKTSLFLTLSRTVWITYLFYEILNLIFCNKNKKKYLYFLVLLLIFSLALVYTLYFLKFDLFFLFDKTLGGRIEQFSTLQNISFFPAKNFVDLIEIVYLSILENFGILGLLTFIIGLFSPLFFFFLKKNHSPLNKRIAISLVTYYFACLSDGAMLYIPTMSFYWFLVALLTSNKIVLKLPSSLENNIDLRNCLYLDKKNIL